MAIRTFGKCSVTGETPAPPFPTYCPTAEGCAMTPDFLDFGTFGASSDRMYIFISHLASGSCDDDPSIGQ